MFSAYAVRRVARICAGRGGLVMISARTALLVEVDLRDPGERRIEGLTELSPPASSSMRRPRVRGAPA